MSLPWKTKEIQVWLPADESYAEVQVDKQQWSYSIHPQSLATFRDHPEGLEIMIKVTGVKDEDEARKLCEIVAVAVAE